MVRRFTLPPFLHALDRPQPPRRLNSRTVLAGKGVEVCDAGSYGLHLIARANRRAAAETWNVPQVRVLALFLLNSAH